MARTSVPGARPGYLRQICSMVATLLLLAGLSGCGGESPTALPPTAQVPAQETPLTTVSPTPTTALAPAQETRETPAPPTTTARTPTQETPPTTVLPTSTTAEELRSDRDRDNSPPATRADLRELVQGNNDFAFDLYRALSDEEGNLFYSPFSISQALAMTFAGARSETERQMADTLHYRLPQAAFIPHSTLWTGRLPREARIRIRGTLKEGEAKQYIRLNIANAVWGQHGFGFLPDFLDVLAENYGAGMRTMDFAGAPEESRVRINDWVAEETGDKVKNLLRPRTIEPNTRLVLTNAIYFNASWHWPFDRRQTKVGPFHLEGGGSVDVPMMTETSDDFYGYARGDGYQAVDVPYSWGEMSMTVLLPDGGALAELEDSLNADLLDRIMDDIEIDYVTLTMPLFEFESEFSLRRYPGRNGDARRLRPQSRFLRHDRHQGPGDLPCRPQGVRIGGRKRHRGGCGHGGGGRASRTPGQRAHSRNGQPALHLPHPGHGHWHGPVPGPRDESGPGRGQRRKVNHHRQETTTTVGGPALAHSFRSSSGKSQEARNRAFPPRGPSQA